MTRETLDRFLTYVLVAAALVIAVGAARREFGARPPANEAKAVSESQWSEIVEQSRFRGSVNAKARIVQFADYQCPYCRLFHNRVDSIVKAHDLDVAVGMAHFPLRSHRFARQAALAVECAADQHAYERLNDLLFAKQDSIGLIDWGEFAHRAGVPDTVALVKCVVAESHAATVDSASALGNRLEVRATPTVFMNGLRFTAPPSDEQLTRELRKAAGR